MGKLYRIEDGKCGRRSAREPHGTHATGWKGAARGLGPILVALPLAAFTAVFVLDGFPPADAASPAAGAETVRKHFARCAGPVRTTCVVDGDTIWLNGDKIRIADIDTPEISQPRCAREERLGQQATERLIVLLNAARSNCAPTPAAATRIATVASCACCRVAARASAACSWPKGWRTYGPAGVGGGADLAPHACLPRKPRLSALSRWRMVRSCCSREGDGLCLHCCFPSARASTLKMAIDGARLA